MLVVKMLVFTHLPILQHGGHGYHHRSLIQCVQPPSESRILHYTAAFLTGCFFRTDETMREGEWEPLKILVLRVRDFNPKDQPERPSRDSEQQIRSQHKLVSFVCTKNHKN
jgi:hypothetical protein